MTKYLEYLTFTKVNIRIESLWPRISQDCCGLFWEHRLHQKWQHTTKGEPTPLNNRVASLRKKLDQEAFLNSSLALLLANSHL